MLIAHMSDLHYAGKTLAETDRCFSFAVDRAIAGGVDCAVISGDSTDHALDIHAPAVEALARNVRRLADHCPVLMLQGTFSHEPPGTLNVFRLLGGRFAVFVADRIGQAALTADGRWIASEGWRFDELPRDVIALFSCVPTVNKAAVAAAVGVVEAAGAVGEQLAALLRGFCPGNAAACRLGIPTIGVSHGTVNGCHDRTWCADGRARSRILERCAVRGGRCRIHARAHPQAPGLARRLAACGLRRLDWATALRRGRREGVRPLGYRRPRCELGAHHDTRTSHS